MSSEWAVGPREEIRRLHLELAQLRAQRLGKSEGNGTGRLRGARQNGGTRHNGRDRF